MTSIKKWLGLNTERLDGKTVAITGSTGGIGRELTSYLAELGAALILVDRNRGRSEALKGELEEKFPNAKIECITADLSDIESVKSAADCLSEKEIDVFIHNAGAYSIPRKICSTGLDNVYQINFVSPYYMIKRLLPRIAERGGRVVAVSSIAHNYSKVDRASVDFRDRRAASLVYGNAKRYLTFALGELFREEKSASLAVVHPGITFTGITAHYPKLIFALIKHPMKVIFMKPARAALSVLCGVFVSTERKEWIGPRLFNVWGLPKKKKLKTAREDEIEFISATAERIYQDIAKDT